LENRLYIFSAHSSNETHNLTIYYALSIFLLQYPSNRLIQF